MKSHKTVLCGTPDRVQERGGNKWQGQQKRYKKNTEKKSSWGFRYVWLTIYVRLSVDSDEKKSEPIETQVTLIKEFIQKHNENPNREYEIAVYNIYSDLGKPEQILTDRDLNG